MANFLDRRGGLRTPAAAANLPLPPGEARTPDTRSLTTQEAAGALERDWLFQAMGEPLLDRAAKEMMWARELAARLARNPTSSGFSTELHKLDLLEKRLAEMRQTPATVPADRQSRANTQLGVVSRRKTR